jgi:hypothetical protein
MDQRGPDGVADAEALDGAAQMALTKPADIAPELLQRVEPIFFDQAFGQAESHGCVVGPLARFQVERAAADHICYGFRCPGRLEFQRGPQGVPHGQADQAVKVPIPPLFSFHYYFLQLRSHLQAFPPNGSERDSPVFCAAG